jgi:hypothetical protein
MIVFSADLHLSPTIWTDQPALRGDAYFAWHQIVAYCLKHKPSALILGGDVWDRSRPDPESVVVFTKAIDKLAAADIRVLAIQGQHERASTPWTDVNEHITYIGDGKPRLIDDDLGAVKICGFDCQSATTLKPLVEQADCDILVIHQLARQLLNTNSNFAWDFDETWATDRVRLILAGDYHTAVNKGRMYYSGSTHMRSIDERTPRFFLVVGSGFKVANIPLKQRPVITVTVLDESQLQEAIDTITDFKAAADIPAAIRIPVVYARISSEVANVASALQAVCGDKYLKLKILGGGTQVVTPAELPAGHVTLESCLDQAVDRLTDPELYDFVLLLLKSKTPKSVCEETRARLGI